MGQFEATCTTMSPEEAQKMADELTRDIKVGKLHMWQSRVEIGYYSVAYIDRVTAFKAPYL